MRLAQLLRKAAITRWGGKAIALVIILGLTLFNGYTALAGSLHGYPATNTLATANLGNKVKGSVQQAGGKVEETVGNLTGDRELQVQGKLQQAEGQIRSVPSDAGGNRVDANSEAVINGKTQQAESNIRRFQARNQESTNAKNALQ